MKLAEKKYHIELEQVMELYADMVYRVSVSITKNEEDAKDVFQETFLRLVRYQETITSEEHLKAWLIRVATNCAKTLVQNPWNQRTQGMEEMENSISCEDVYEQEENTLLSELQGLPSKYSVVLYLFYYEGYSVKEIGKILNKKENSIKTLLNRGRGLLKTKLMEGGICYE